MKRMGSCPICESLEVALDYEGSTARRQEDSARWSVSRCGDCGHRFVNPQPGWEDLTGYYDAGYEPYEAEHGVADFDELLASAQRTGALRHVQIPAGIRLLDVGCGGGVFLRLARELGAICTGVEPSEHGAATSRSTHLDIFHGNLTDFVKARPDSRFDLITANHVVEHHPDPVALLVEMKTLLAPGGVAWIAVPNGDCRSARTLKWRWHSTDLPYHLHHFSRVSLRRAVERGGFGLQQLRTESMPAAVRASMLSELRHVWKLPIRLTEHLPLLSVAARRATRMDESVEGEAFLATMA